MRISDWSSDVCSSDLWRVRCSWSESLVCIRCRPAIGQGRFVRVGHVGEVAHNWPANSSPTDATMMKMDSQWPDCLRVRRFAAERVQARSEEHTSELQSLMRISYAVFCLKKKKDKMIEQGKKTAKHKRGKSNTTNSIQRVKDVQDRKTKE